MSIRMSEPVRFRPIGLSDTLDSTEVFPGAMTNLVNLIPDPSTKNLWSCRPGMSLLPNFASGFTTPGFISAIKVVGNRVFGMMATARNAGQDEPFCYDLVTNTVVTVTGIVAGNTPTSPPTTGPWTPPTIDQVGVRLFVTHPGFNGANGMFGWFDLTNPAAITWQSGNTTGAIALSTPPVGVAQFNNRAWFLVNPVSGQPTIVFTDTLSINVTNATQALTLGDNVKLTALIGLPLENQLGGIIQSLIVFKGVTDGYQITGDIVTTNLAVNALTIATGTNSVLSLTTTPKGIAFLAPGGIRVLDFYARLSDPIGVAGAGVTVPFIYAAQQSRVVAACNDNVFRISVANLNVAGTPNQEYWYDIARQVWSGPHTSACNQIDAYNQTFICTPIGHDGALYQSDAVQTATSAFTEFGTQLTFNYQTSMLPDTNKMAEFAIGETTINMALQAGMQPLTVSALDQNGTILNSVQYPVVGTPSLWGTMVWGTSLWGGAVNNLTSRRIDWTIPVVSRRWAFQVLGNSGSGVKLGDAFFRYEILNYIQQGA